MAQATATTTAQAQMTKVPCGSLSSLTQLVMLLVLHLQPPLPHRPLQPLQASSKNMRGSSARGRTPCLHPVTRCRTAVTLLRDSLPALDDNQRLRENVQARLEEKTSEFDTLIKEKTQLDRDYQMLTIKVKDSERKARLRKIAPLYPPCFC